MNEDLQPNKFIDYYGVFVIVVAIVGIVNLFFSLNDPPSPPHDLSPYEQELKDEQEMWDGRDQDDIYAP